MGTPSFWETDFTIRLADQMSPIQCTIFAELWLQKMGDFYENRFLQ